MRKLGLVALFSKGQNKWRPSNINIPDGFGPRIAKKKGSSLMRSIIFTEEENTDVFDLRKMHLLNLCL